MATQEKRAPVLVAAFTEEEQLEGAIQALMERKIGPDFIGAFVGDSENGPNGVRKLYLLSVLAPSRLHEEIAATFQKYGAEATGDVPEMRARYRYIPHPGCAEYEELKVPMGDEYWQFVAKRKRKKAKE